jgi:hypothetical protein
LNVIFFFEALGFGVWQYDTETAIQNKKLKVNFRGTVRKTQVRMKMEGEGKT